MTACVASRGPRPVVLSIIAAAFALFAPPALAVDPVDKSTVVEPVTVNLDQAKLLKLPERTATLVIGNPLIADAVVQPGGVVVVTAKSYGMTNLVALDRTGNSLMERLIQVVGPSDAVVVVYRGIERESYSCAPKCERRITLGDTSPYFTQNLTAVGTYSAQAQGQAQKQ
jgi:Flp pilus assembly secretin CpaC